VGKSSPFKIQFASQTLSVHVTLRKPILLSATPVDADASPAFNKHGPIANP
jgi:hypothetical protein